MTVPANKFINDAAVGLNDGTSWANAWTNFNASAILANLSAGDIVAIANTHNETIDASKTLNFRGTPGAVCMLVSTNPANDEYTAGATITATVQNNASAYLDFYSENFIMKGVNYSFPTQIRIPFGNYQSILLEDCTFKANNTYASTGTAYKTYGSGVQDVRLHNVTLDSVLTSRNIVFDFANSSANVEWIGGSVLFPTLYFADTYATATELYLANLDISQISSKIFTGTLTTDKAINIKVIDCKIGTGVTLCDVDMSSATLDSRIEFFRCEAGILAAAAFKYDHYQQSGNSNTVLTHYRTNGADDGQQANPYSQKMIAAANRTKKGLMSVWFDSSIYLPTIGGAKTIKAHVAHAGVGSGTAGALQDDEFWIEVFGPSDAVTPTSGGAITSSNGGAFKTTPTDLPIEAGETWNGTGVGTKQSASVSYTPTIEGMINVRIHFATSNAAAKIIYVCPKIEVI